MNFSTATKVAPTWRHKRPRRKKQRPRPVRGRDKRENKAKGQIERSLLTFVRRLCSLFSHESCTRVSSVLCASCRLGARQSRRPTHTDCTRGQDLWLCHHVPTKFRCGPLPSQRFGNNLFELLRWLLNTRASGIDPLIHNWRPSLFGCRTMYVQESVAHYLY
jgi:hypothetical protein